jgi:hypothetical protein
MQVAESKLAPLCGEETKMLKHCSYCGREMEDDWQDCPTCHKGQVAVPRLGGFVDGILLLPGVDLVIDVQSHEGDEPSASDEPQEGEESADKQSES